MFDLAIITTLESKTLAAYPPCACRRFPLAPGIGRDFALRLKIQSSRFKKKSSFDFSPGILCSAQSPGFGNERCSFRNLTIRS
ncbi:hypothetical protein GQ457_09G017290 [Hibiscus cannabinus]